MFYSTYNDTVGYAITINADCDNCTKGLLVTGASSQDNYKTISLFEICFRSIKITIAASAFKMKCTGIIRIKMT